MVIKYVLRCDGCGARASEQDLDDACFARPAGWQMFAIRSYGSRDQDIAVCDTCWNGRTCAEVFSRVSWGGTPSVL